MKTISILRTAIAAHESAAKRHHSARTNRDQHNATTASKEAHEATTLAQEAVVVTGIQAVMESVAFALGESNAAADAATYSANANAADSHEQAIRLLVQAINAIDASRESC